MNIITAEEAYKMATTGKPTDELVAEKVWNRQKNILLKNAFNSIRIASLNHYTNCSIKIKQNNLTFSQYEYFKIFFINHLKEFGFIACKGWNKDLLYISWLHKEKPKQALWQKIKEDFNGPS